MPLRVRIILALLPVVAFGFASKFYPGPGRWWVNNWGPASVAYVVFFMLIAFLMVPRRRAVIPIAAGVCLATCLLELLQLCEATWLQVVRSTFLGGCLLGTTFSWWDFPAYLVGAALGCFLLWLLSHHASGANASQSADHATRQEPAPGSADHSK